jgi:hypothetical protein
MKVLASGKHTARRGGNAGWRVWYVTAEHWSKQLLIGQAGRPLSQYPTTKQPGLRVSAAKLGPKLTWQPSRANKPLITAHCTAASGSTCVTPEVTPRPRRAAA